MIRSGRLGDCDKDNSLLTAESHIKRIIALSILFTSLSNKYINVCSFAFDYKRVKSELQYILADKTIGNGDEGY